MTPHHPYRGDAAPTDRGIAWWNALSDEQRAERLEYAARVLGRPASAGDAWSLHCDRLPAGPVGGGKP